jgi:HEXXH motif-containing protein
MLKNHALSGEMFTALATGHGGASAGSWLAATERSKHLMLLRGVVHTADVASHPRAEEIHGAYQALSAMHQQIASAVDRTVRQPAVGAWALDAILRMRRHELTRDIPERINALAAAAAMRARLPYFTTVPVIGGKVVLPSIGLVSLDNCTGEPTARVCITMNGAEVITARSCIRVPADWSRDADGWQGLRAITAASRGMVLRVIVDDVDPYRFAASAGIGTRLGSEEAGHWGATVREAWHLLVKHHGRVADEVRTMVTTLTPLLAQGRDQRNATSQTTFGCVAVSCPRDGRTLALALAHEVQHAKLSALLDLVDLVKPGAKALYYAPWRDDPRPVVALLQGTYAHLGVAGFWRRQRQHEEAWSGLLSQVEFARWSRATAEAVRTLDECPELTPLGHLFVAGIRSAVDSWHRERVPCEAADLAGSGAEEHRQRWLSVHGGQLGGGSKS